MDEILKAMFKSKDILKLKFIKSLFSKTNNEYIRVEGSLYILTIDGIDYKYKTNTKEPIFNINLSIVLKKDSFSGVNKDYNTTIGKAIINYLFLDFALDNIFNIYIEKQFTFKDLEGEYILPNRELVTLLRYKKCGLVVTFIRKLADVIVIPATEKGMAKPVWLDKFKKDTEAKLISKYGKDAMSDVKVFLEYEKIIMAEYHNYLKDDPTYGITFDKKIINTSLKKKFVSMGVLDSIDSNSPVGLIKESLKDGFPNDKSKMATIINNIVNGSYQRGVSTQDSGYLSKLLMRALFPYKILKKDCGTKGFLNILVTKSIRKNLVGMYQFINGKSVIITSKESKSLVGKNIKLRMNTYCISQRGTFCEFCSGKELGRVEYGIALLASELGGMGLKHNLSKFHVTNYTVYNIGIDDLIY